MPVTRVQTIGDNPTDANPSGLRTYTLEQIAQMPIARYMQINNKIVNGRSQVYWDTVRLEAGTNWTSAQPVRVFAVGREQAGTIANTATAITKSDFDTNMFKGGSFEFGTTVIVYGVEVRIVLPSRLNTADTSGIVSNPAPASKSANTYAATNLMETICNQTKLTFYRGERPEENGLLWMFPTRFGYTASFGGDTEEGFIQTYSIGGSVLDFPKVLVHDEDFNLKLEPLAPTLALPSDIAIRILLLTKRLGEL